ncbi:MAG: hypothetical protein ACYCU8_08325 [Ferrimicrobium acidiphilum]
MPWDIVFYRDIAGNVPADDFLDDCPVNVRARLMAILDAVAEAPPPQFSGGGQWEAMHGDMSGYYEIRSQGAKREQFRLFCILENSDAEELRRRGLPRPAVAVVTGMRKPWMTVFSSQDYQHVRTLGNDYLHTKPRRIATTS